MFEEAMMEDGFKHTERDLDLHDLNDEEVDDYLIKIRNFDADFLTDIYLPESRRLLLNSTVARLERVQNYVGHGNFNLLGFDEMLFFARNYQEIGPSRRSNWIFWRKSSLPMPTSTAFLAKK